MRLLALGDVVASPGRSVVRNFLPGLRKKLDIDCVVVNGDNVSHGFGMSDDGAREMFEAGADVITCGNHFLDQRSLVPLMERDPRILRPHNMSKNIPGNGLALLTLNDGRKVLVVHLLAQLAMPMIGDDPFDAMQNILRQYTLGANVHAIIVDFHGEMTSEKMALGHFVDGKVSCLFGTHTHIPTADERILRGGTAYQTDIGMCGVYDSVIGAEKHISVDRFVRKRSEKNRSAHGDATLCALFVETDDTTGLAIRVEAMRIGGDLKQTSDFNTSH